MDRYFIARQAVSDKPLVLPKKEDVNKFSKNETVPDIISEKADLCYIR